MKQGFSAWLNSSKDFIFFLSKKQNKLKKIESGLLVFFFNLYRQLNAFINTTWRPKYNVCLLKGKSGINTEWIV